MTPEEEQIQYQLQLDRLQHEQMRTRDTTRPAPLPASPRMSGGIFLVALILSIGADALEIITVGTVGWLAGIFVDLVLLVLLGFSKGARKQWRKLLTALIGESLPVISILPLRTIMVIWSFLSSRSAILRSLAPSAHKVAGIK